jgi:hypothetical protein
MNSTKLTPPLNRSLVIWGAVITVGIILIILTVNLVLYFTRKGWFAPYKAQPAKGDDTDYYYPNGKPDPTTGKPKGSTTIPQGVQTILNANLTQYQSISGSANAGWGYIANTNK